NAGASSRCGAHDGHPHPHRAHRTPARHPHRVTPVARHRDHRRPSRARPARAYPVTRDGVPNRAQTRRAARSPNDSAQSVAFSSKTARYAAASCRGHFVKHCAEQVRRAIKDHDMIRAGERVVVAVSGGKDSLALWDLLVDLGYRPDGLYLGLGIGEYSEASGHAARAYAHDRGLKLHEVDLAADFGYDIPRAAAATHRAPCGACGLSKRHLFNAVAVEHGY